MREVDHELAFLLSLDGAEYRFAAGYRVKLEARVVKAAPGRPHGIKYSLTLHDPTDRRIYGLDNAHKSRPTARVRSPSCLRRPQDHRLQLSRAGAIAR